MVAHQALEMGSSTKNDVFLLVASRKHVTYMEKYDDKGMEWSQAMCDL